MTRFEDGPAKGQTLMLNRAPVFLRVVRCADAKWDALDLVDDTPEPSETIYVYLRVGEPGHAFVDGTKDGKRWGRSCAVATYRLYPEQPEEAVMRSTEAWRAWCQTEGEKNAS